MARIVSNRYNMAGNWRLKVQTDASHSDVNCFGCQFLETSNQVVVLKTEAEDGPPVYDEPTCENKDGYQGVYSAGIHDANSFIDGSPYVTDWRSEIQIKQEECSFETTPQNRSDKERAREGERKGPQIHRNITRYMGVKEENHCAAKNYEPPSGMVDLRLFNDLKRDDKMTKEQRDEDRMRRMDSDWQGNELDFELISLDTESFDNFFNAKVENAFVDSLMRDAVNQTDNIGCTPSWHGESLVGPDAMESLYCNSTRKDNAIENGTENGVTECGVVDMEEPKITLGAEEVKLLKEALRTRSLEPVAYLLSRLTKKPNSTLSDGTLESCATYRTDTPRSPEDDMSSALSDYHGRLSSQDSWDSDRSSVLSDGQSGKRFSDGDLDDILRNNQLMRRGSEDQAIDSLRLTGIERGMKITEDARTKSHGDEMDGGNAVSDIVSAIDDMMKSSSDCDLDFFRDLLEKDGAEQIKQAATSKVWEEAGKNIMEVKEETIGRLEKNASRKSERLLMDHFSDGNLIQGDDQRLTKQTTQRVGPNRCYHLWDFLRELLNKGCSNVVEWTDTADDEFKLIDTKLLADLWGQKKKLPNMNYDKLSRSLRYYIKLDILRKVPGKRLHFRFGKGRMWKKMKK